MRFKVNGYLKLCDYYLSDNSFDCYLIKENKLDCLPTIKFEKPSIITNSIIELKKYAEGNELREILTITDSLLCKHYVLKYSQVLSLKELEKLFEEILRFNVHEVLLILTYSEEMYSDSLIDVLLTSNRFKAVIFTDSPFSKSLDDIIFYLKENTVIRQNKNIGSFDVNIDLYSESQLYHTYFNRKLFFGPNGEIKNAPECDEIYGNLNDLKSPDDIKSIISKPDFQKYWFVHKEMCDVCKDCEFRHMCVDNRVPVERAKDEWYHIEECNYNPYIAKWEDEEGYRTLSECGVISNEHTFSIDHEKIAKINAELWPEE